LRLIGQVCLLLSLVGTGYAAFACVIGWYYGRRGIVRAGIASACVGFVGLTIALILLGYALLVRDFSFLYVSQYSSRLLPWHYSLSALWVGQAGSLLLWAWMLGLLAFVYRILSRKNGSPLRSPAFGLVMGVVCFIVATMVFGADPMQHAPGLRDEGEGLSPLLQHPAMLIHPPIVFLGYSLWAVPCALAISVLLNNRRIAANASHNFIGASSNDSSQHVPTVQALQQPAIGADWLSDARPWALLAWITLGVGILLGAEWSYEELGWGGYWAWDPVENGSLIPWLTGTICLHGMMAWRFLGILKKIALALAITTFGLCNFATFLTRSGIFSSLHAFSQSPIGWMFLGLMIVLAVGGGFLIVRQRSALVPENTIRTIWSREAQILISATALSLMAIVALIGTLSVALSDFIFGRRIVVGTEFYNNVLIPVGLVLLATIALAPLLRWGRNPTTAQLKCMRGSVLFPARWSAQRGFTGSGAHWYLALADLPA
jgi:cytochrome c-type biogenesis protein CcmF